MGALERLSTTDMSSRGALPLELSPRRGADGLFQQELDSVLDSQSAKGSLELGVPQALGESQGNDLRGDQGGDQGLGLFQLAGVGNALSFQTSPSFSPETPTGAEDYLARLDQDLSSIETSLNLLNGLSRETPRVPVIPNHSATTSSSQEFARASFGPSASLKSQGQLASQLAVGKLSEAQFADPVQAPIIAEMLGELQQATGIAPREVVEALKDLPVRQLEAPPQELAKGLAEKLSATHDIQPDAVEPIIASHLTAIATLGAVIESQFEPQSTAVSGLGKIKDADLLRYDMRTGTPVSQEFLERSNLGNVNKKVNNQLNNKDQVPFDLMRSRLGSSNEDLKVETFPQAALSTEDQLAADFQVRSNLLSIKERLGNLNSTADAAPAPTILAAGVGAIAMASPNESSDSNDQDRKGDNLAGQGEALPVDLTQISQTPKEFKVENAKLDRAVIAPQSVQEIKDKTEALSKSGGGQVKIELAPEGLGSIQLKVKVDNGQVNVSILAENQDTKRLLESRLGDLKSGLEAQKLNLDQVRVEMTERSQARENLMNQFNRQQARDFLQDFRQQNENFRQSSFLGGFPDRPMGVDARVRKFNPQELSGRSVRGQSRRLDLVA